MRMRPKKNRNIRLEKVERLFAVKENGKIDIKKSFEREAKLFLEIGCGKGSFSVKTAERNPDANYLALEKVSDVILMAMERADREQIPNIRFCLGDAENITELLDGVKADSIFINFCDPWPKARNAKRRLTSPLYLERYKKLLADGARIYFKTDNRPLFDYSLEQFELCGYKLQNVCYDLHSSSLNETNIETEYEKTFSEKGFNINYLEAFIAPESEDN